MSTRRARIKAVTALPPRRKNIDTKDNSKNNVAEKTSESPNKTPKLFVEAESEILVQNNTNCSPKTIGNEDVSIRKTQSPKLKSPHAASKKSETPKISINSSDIRQSPVIISPFRKAPTEKRTLFSPPPNLIVRNSNAGKTLEKDINKSVTDDGKNKDTSKTIDVIDYNVPSVPESLTDEAMDGIIPLKPVSSGPKPIDLWKNEIISENAEVLFDPIVPLPSPSKVRPKVRPVPRLVPLRRNSIQGSASESEDESRRLHGGGSTPAQARQRHDSQTSHSTTHTIINREVNRVRNNSFCSSVGQQASHAPPPPASPMKEKHISKRSRAEQARRLALRRRRSPRPDTLTMYDLIFYNPTANPILPDQEEMKAKEANAKDAEAHKESENEVDEDNPDDPSSGAAPVPQIKLGPNGEIMLDEQSLVIKQSNSGRKVSNSVVREGAWSGGGGRYSRSARTADWSAEETVRFYRALAAVGTDFSLMTPLFPNRNRRDLKLKFKKEERQNAAQVDKALRSVSSWDVVRLQEEFREERAEAARQVQKEKERLLQWKEKEKTARLASGRISRAARAVQTTSHASGNVANPLTADAIIQRAKQMAHKRKQRNLQKMDSIENPLPNNQLSTDMKRIPINIAIPEVPANIEEGSLVVLTVNDPSSPSKKMLQTYISRGPGNLTPVALPPQLLNSVVNYMKKGGTTPKSVRSNTSSPAIHSPSSVASTRTEPSPKRIRHSSFTITQL